MADTIQALIAFLKETRIIEAAVQRAKELEEIDREAEKSKSPLSAIFREVKKPDKDETTKGKKKKKEMKKEPTVLSTTALTTMPENWWEKPHTQYAFSHPHIQARVEHLMSTNVVRLTDRHYMQKMQQRLREDHLETFQKRINDREAAESERQKKLMLFGLLPQVGHDDHPVFKVTKLTDTMIKERRELESKKLKVRQRILAKRAEACESLYRQEPEPEEEAEEEEVAEEAEVAEEEQ